MKDKSILYLIILIFIISCSSSNKKGTFTKSQCHQHKDILSYYKHLREKKNSSDKKVKSYLEWLKDKNQNAYFSMKPCSIKPVSSKRKKNIPKSFKSQKEVTIEIEQNMTYFCMVNRKNEKFNDKNACTSFTKETYNFCKNKYTDERSERTLRCLKKILWKRKI